MALSFKEIMRLRQIGKTAANTINHAAYFNTLKTLQRQWWEGIISPLSIGMGTDFIVAPTGTGPVLKYINRHAGRLAWRLYSERK